MKKVDNIYQENADYVKRFLVALTFDVDLAEELTQETFYQAVKSIDKYNGTCKFPVWLCQIAKHCYYNHLRKKKNDNVESLDVLNEKGIDFDNKELQISEIIETRDSYVSIHKIIHNLPEPYREVFVLRYFSDLSFKEIGEIVGKSESYARVNYYRARQKIKEQMEDTL